jgi:MFS family permease
MTTESAAIKNESTSGVGIREKLSYGAGNFAEMMIYNPATAFIVFFYTDVVGIAAATVGTLLLVSRAFDLFNPVMGIIVDRTHSRHGKGRPWLLWLAVPFGVSAVLLFTVPPLGMIGKIVYAFITYNLALTIIYTAVDIPYSAMLPLQTTDPHDRTMLSIYRMTFSMLGMMFSFAITQPMVKLFGSGGAGLAEVVPCLRSHRDRVVLRLLPRDKGANQAQSGREGRGARSGPVPNSIHQQILADHQRDWLRDVPDDRLVWRQYLLLPLHTSKR